jgi:hypothetical protein
VIVDEINDLPVRRRQLLETVEQNATPFSLLHCWSKNNELAQQQARRAALGDRSPVCRQPQYWTV